MTDLRAGSALLTRIWSELSDGLPSEGAPRAARGAEPGAPASANTSEGARVPLAARTAASELAWASVASVAIAATSLSTQSALRSPDVTALTTALDPARIAVAYSSERHLRFDDEPVNVWSPLSGFFRTSDGWVRTHANYPHHAAALRSALAIEESAGRVELERALSVRSMLDASAAITAAGGLCVPVTAEDPAVDQALRSAPIVRTARLGSAPPRPREFDADAPLRGIRVLDLTRVIAGPVATRTLALFGADVLRIDPPTLPEPAWQHLDTGHGKRSVQLDIRGSQEVFESLLRDADVVVTGYRPAAIASLGLDPTALATRHPGLVVARLSAWGFAPEQSQLRGFDSLVQAASGIAWLESPDGQTPGALPAQALDHSAGYLLAAAIMVLLRRQADEGGTWLAETSLRRIAAELLGMPRTPSAQPLGVADPLPHLQHFNVDGRDVITTAPALAVNGKWRGFATPRGGAVDQPEWLAR